MKIRVFFEGNSYLIWTSKEVEILRREFKIIGNPTFTSSYYRRQLNDLTLPLEILSFEVLWLFNNNYCDIISPKFDLNIFNENFINENPNLYLKVHEENEFEIEYINPPIIPLNIYKTYEYFKNKNFWIMDGLSYGCNFVIYKNEPWKCHSFGLILCSKELFDTRNLIQNVRISNSSKKHLIMIYFNEKNEINLIEIKRFLI